MQTYSLFDLNLHIRQVLSLNFRDPVWITAEIAEAGLSKGHLYLSLVQKTILEEAGDEGIVAQAQAIVWQRDRRKIAATHGPLADLVLNPGVQARMLVRVDFHERYGFKLLIEDIDPAYSLGVLALQRRETIVWLRKEGLVDLNKKWSLPPVIQRIAVITSQDAAGFHDFRAHLAENAYGYQFHCTPFFSAVQGKNAVPELCAALEAIKASARQFEVVVVIRGGGARLDLSVFDDREVCKAVSQMPLPVLTGIGHETDESVLDLTAHTAFKTPTAVADFLIERAMSFESDIALTALQIARFSTHQVRMNAEQLSVIQSSVLHSAQGKILVSGNALQRAMADVPLMVSQYFKQKEQSLEHLDSMVQALAPQTTLQRGFTITLKNGQVMTNAAEVQAGDRIETRFAEGRVESIVVGAGDALTTRP